MGAQHRAHHHRRGLGRLPGAALPQGQAQRDRPARAHPQRLRGGPRHQHREEGMTAEDVNAAFQKACDGPMNGVLEISNEPLVSVDFRKSDYSSCVDGSLTMVMGDDMVKVVAWYDNEWATPSAWSTSPSSWPTRPAPPSPPATPSRTTARAPPAPRSASSSTAKRALA